MNYSAQCSCGNVNLTLSLPKPIEEYLPRACDCRFCTERNIAYLSDPMGELVITSKHSLQSLKQGSEQATFWQCPSCLDMVAVSHQLYDENEVIIKGAVNSRLFESTYTLPEALIASPKTLSPQQKRQRWSELWLTTKLPVRSSP
ncbi:aldehyde-activating protein [Kangiella marina]